jgi:hypothetical protein
MLDDEEAHAKFMSNGDEHSPTSEKNDLKDVKIQKQYMSAGAYGTN